MEIDFADVKPSVLSFLTIGVMALLFITLGKWITQRIAIPGVSDLFQAA